MGSAVLDNKPFSLKTLAARWDCSEGTVRNLIVNDRLNYFRIGVLFRIPMTEVVRFETCNTPSNDSGEDTPSDGRIKPANLTVTDSSLPIVRAPRRRPDPGGLGPIAHHGQ